MSSFRRFAGVVTLLSACAMAQPLGAQTDANRAAARDMATSGLDAFKAGDWARAVDMFTRAEALVHSPRHLLYVARASEKLGKLIQAQEAYEKVRRETLPADAPPAFQVAQEEAEAELERLKPRLPKVTIVVEGGAARVVVTLDGAELPAALIGVPTPANPGAHELQARAGDRASEVVKVDLAEGAAETVTLTLTDTPGAGASPGAKEGGVAVDSASGSNGSMPALRIASFGALGVGVIGLGVGTVFLIQKGSKEDDYDAFCGGGTCRESQRAKAESLQSEVDSAATLSTVGFVVGGVGVAAGVTMFILSAGDGEKAAGPSITPFATYDSAGVAGRF